MSKRHPPQCWYWYTVSTGTQASLNVYACGGFSGTSK